MKTCCRSSQLHPATASPFVDSRINRGSSWTTDLQQTVNRLSNWSALKSERPSFKNIFIIISWRIILLTKRFCNQTVLNLLALIVSFTMEDLVVFFFWQLSRKIVSKVFLEAVRIEANMLVLAGIVEISAKTCACFHPMKMIVVTRTSCFRKPKINIWAWLK